MPLTLSVFDFIVIASIVIVITTCSRLLTPNYSRILARSERRLDAVLSHLGIDLTTMASETYGLSHAVIALADDNKKIAAIKRHRNETGLPLSEAKQQVERYFYGM